MCLSKMTTKQMLLVYWLKSEMPLLCLDVVAHGGHLCSLEHGEGGSKAAVANLQIGRLNSLLRVLEMSIVERPQGEAGVFV